MHIVIIVMIIIVPLKWLIWGMLKTKQNKIEKHLSFLFLNYFIPSCAWSQPFSSSLFHIAFVEEEGAIIVSQQ